MGAFGDGRRRYLLFEKHWDSFSMISIFEQLGHITVREKHDEFYPYSMSEGVLQDISGDTNDS
ncbi:hypothetical protein F441_00408 [Phytophthora nicotianae CJ01A1]|uniref:Uncharacterized protein n=3 Tax=Phytophthora nicotianae TaxID=4792 RepID=W2RGS7_PHYN3|nr:hypothetical protein PPTG_20713 [Phytophthora nicotianae INRA-310]ETM56702.1 hypothetical protein L914_00383 [Phytophthora nicotianae]ETN23829.1 hypothetical protein PPTG_20713 [Phytophthora nicotianae INRA-310]ETP27026.1 hypothetical protein F441_00408 [Phytophthora nicotianae CJ01A1]